MSVNPIPAHRPHMLNKADRHGVIRDLIRANRVESQEDLRRLLTDRGVRVTQATLSRDLRELGIARIPGSDGPRYAESDSGGDALSLDAVLPQLFSRIDAVREL